MSGDNAEAERLAVDDARASPTKWDSGGYWEDQMAKRLNREPSGARRAIMLAEALEECAAVFRAGPFIFPITVYREDEPKMEAVRRVAQLARTVASELRSLAGGGDAKLSSTANTDEASDMNQEPLPPTQGEGT